MYNIIDNISTPTMISVLPLNNSIVTPGQLSEPIVRCC